MAPPRAHAQSGSSAPVIPCVAQELWEGWEQGGWLEHRARGKAKHLMLENIPKDKVKEKTTIKRNMLWDRNINVV